MSVRLISALSFVVFAPLIGGLISGIDRRITARMQGRFGPPVLQPFYDVYKLLQKENVIARVRQNAYIDFYLLFVIFSGMLLFAGQDLLLFIFSLTLASVFFILAAFKGSSPYSLVGAQRELLLVMGYEPMVLFAAVAFYMATGSFWVSKIIVHPVLLIKLLPGIFLGFFYILTIKLRKSPYDLSTSHHGHQELVKGLTTEFAGPSLAMIEVAHWYETVFLLAFVYLFFAATPWLGALAVVVCYFLEILIDNVFARAKWEVAVKSSWLVAAVLGFGNVAVLYLLKGF
ncbi:MAG: NADH-quinone oxidoreductase subunit H [Opitutaceae bacterium]|nr:NADH-quinone oxidoreductase subunit H [Opitutaceae bacterium]